MTQLKTPDLTPAQLISTVGGIVGLLVTQGFVSDSTSKLVGGLASIIIPVAWQFADAHIRNGRSQAQATIIAAKSALPVAVVPNEEPVAVVTDRVKVVVPPKPRRVTPPKKTR